MPELPCPMYYYKGLFMQLFLPSDGHTHEVVGNVSLSGVC